MTSAKIYQLLHLDVMTICRPELFFRLERKKTKNKKSNSAATVFLLSHMSESNEQIRKSETIKFTHLDILHVLHRLEEQKQKRQYNGERKREENHKSQLRNYLNGGKNTEQGSRGCSSSSDLSRETFDHTVPYSKEADSITFYPLDLVDTKESLENSLDVGGQSLPLTFSASLSPSLLLTI